MNAIIGFADLLEKHIDEKERVRDYIGKIKSSSEFLLSLINYVLETARIESGNSLKYTPAGGKITIDIREIPFDRENYIAYKIVVEDTGIGMSEDYLPHILKNFPDNIQVRKAK